MKRLLALSKRNLLETVRDPLSLVFCLILPLFMLAAISVLADNMGEIPPNFQIEAFASGICVFGYTFISLFIAMQIAGDRNSSLIKRLDISPISRFCYYASFFVSSLPIVLTQTVLFFAAALCFGFPWGGLLFLNMLYLLPSAVFYTCIGILIGCLCKNERQTGPVSSIFISLTGFLGGIFMPLGLFQGGFQTFVDLLPFGHSVSIGSELYQVGASCIYPHILYILAYIFIVIAVVAVIETIRKYKK